CNRIRNSVYIRRFIAYLIHIRHGCYDFGWLDLRAGLCNNPTLHDEVSVVAVLPDTCDEQNIRYGDMYLWYQHVSCTWGSVFKAAAY
ncbi:hypothetical protein COCCADRAFT_106531, partial [Bipolaris zeicola 26-R-13]